MRAIVAQVARITDSIRGRCKWYMFLGNGIWQFHLDAGVFMSKLDPVFLSMSNKADLNARDAQVNAITSYIMPQ